MTTWTMNATGFSNIPRVDLTGTILRYLARARKTWMKYKEYRHGVAELNACSDRVLQDLGIYRSDIRRLSREAIYGR